MQDFDLFIRVIVSFQQVVMLNLWPEFSHNKSFCQDYVVGCIIWFFIVCLIARIIIIHFVRVNDLMVKKQSIIEWTGWDLNPRPPTYPLP
jgi:hypothetical protein